MKIAGNFEESLQFWSYLVRKKIVGDPKTFIHKIPHISFVWGQENVDFLRAHYEAMKSHPLFDEMQYGTDYNLLKEWMPLVMEGRSPVVPFAATRVYAGTDVDFGSLTRQLFAYLKKQQGVSLHLRHEV